MSCRVWDPTPSCLQAYSRARCTTVVVSITDEHKTPRFPTIQGRLGECAALSSALGPTLAFSILCLEQRLVSNLQTST